MELSNVIQDWQWRIQDFPLGGRRANGGRRPLMQVLFDENVCKNEGIGSHWGGGEWGHVPVARPGSANN